VFCTYCLFCLVATPTTQAVYDDFTVFVGARTDS
jgi:hypothetical protein